MVKQSKPQNKDRNLFSTITGSHLWNMQKEDSDIDISTMYIQDSSEYLIHGSPKGKKMFKYTNSDGTLIEEQKYELQKVIKLLINGNANMIWMVTSPSIEFQHRNALSELRQITIDNLSKQTFYSIQGMARNNIKDFIEHGDHKSDKYKKKLNVIGRNLQFGINLLLYGKTLYTPLIIHSAEQLNPLMIQLHEAYNISRLPEKVNPEPFYNYLIKWRIKKLREDELI